MTTKEILKEIEHLPFSERIFIIEKTIHLIKEQANKSQLEKAADKMLKDYVSDVELTSFTNLDYENFYEAR